MRFHSTFYHIVTMSFILNKLHEENKKVNFVQQCGFKDRA